MVTDFFGGVKSVELTSSHSSLDRPKPDVPEKDLADTVNRFFDDGAKMQHRIQAKLLIRRDPSRLYQIEFIASGMTFVVVVLAAMFMS